MKEIEKTRNIQRKVLNELKELRDNFPPKPEADWDLIWVLSGPEESILQNKNSAEINQTLHRLQTAFTISRKVAAKRCQTNAGQMINGQLKEFGPIIYFNGSDVQNDDLKKIKNKGLIETLFDFPQELLIISKNRQIEHTRHQFEYIPQSILGGKRKIVVVTDAYHIPRSLRYPKMPQVKIDQELIYFPSQPLILKFDLIRAEIRKIPRYIKKGDLPRE